MKILIASDIHGSLTYCRRLLVDYESSGASRLLLLGDILYHGPRNSLPEGYDPAGVAGELNKISDRIICIRGNCDSEVDQMVLGFPMMSEQAVIFNGCAALAVHGHKDMQSLSLGGINIVFSGHTHVPKKVVECGVVYANPGSVSIPKADSPRGYIIWEDNRLEWCKIGGEVYDEMAINRALT